MKMSYARKKILAALREKPAKMKGRAIKVLAEAGYIEPDEDGLWHLTEVGRKHADRFAI